MFNLAKFDVGDTLGCGSKLRAATAAATVEEALRNLCTFLYENLGTPDGTRACALVRGYLTLPFDKLSSPDRAFAEKLMPPGLKAWPDMKCLVLLGTRGEDAAWNERRQSRGHRAIPLPTANIVQNAPMIAQLFGQMGLDLDDVITPAPGLVGDLSKKTYNVFHVSQAPGSPHIPAQDFVRSARVESVVGFGGALPWGELFAIILFSKVPVPTSVAHRFKAIALDAKATLLKFDAEHVYQGAADLASKVESAPPVEKRRGPRISAPAHTGDFRRFSDALGRAWNVWAIVPSLDEKGILRTQLDSAGKSSRNDSDDAGHRRRLKWQGGWLLFESQEETRRLSPIPEDWMLLPESALQTLCNEARADRR